MTGASDESAVNAWLALDRLHCLVTSAVSDALAVRDSVCTEELTLLQLLREAADGRMRMSELADAARTTNSRATRLVDRLEFRGHVVREACGDDRRVVFACLAAEGRRALAEIDSALAPVIHEAFASAAARRWAADLTTTP
ncbi:MarR family winged helix-turn-helix transcriptional regulator [Demequina sp. NBRC 110054]|uniref:MarR family winged helix-turn-helix transcriptional regulator n=1 Tax=Demequina sp. NBRC 110054 TaxID=1570343 RepID=UPI000A00FE8B|nr:MarR family transcriptional regulator [Demequina sp. NBRC 110054]